MSIKQTVRAIRVCTLQCGLSMGKRQKDGSYEYIVIPKCNEEEIKRLLQKKRNKSNRKFRLNTVREKKNGITGIVFFKG